MAHEHTGHSHAPKNFGPIFAIATSLNAALVLAQVYYGIAANSVALLADAGHNFGDVLGLVMAWAAHSLSRRQPTQRFTYGLRSASILAALANGVLLLIVTGAIALEAVQRFFAPNDVGAVTVVAVATLGILVNGASAWMLMAGGKGDLNIRGAFLHMVADAAVSAVVVMASVAIIWTGWNWLDPAASLGISAVIVWGAWGLLSESSKMSLGAVPAEIDPADVKVYLQNLPGVSEVHDLHIWSMSTTETALTCHLIIPTGHPGDEFLNRVCQELHDRFEIDHPTLQIELSDAGRCKLASPNVI